MKLFNANIALQVLLISCVVTAPVFAQVKDTSQKTQVQNVQPAAPIQPAATPAVKYPPALQYPPAQQYAPAINAPPARQAVPGKSDYFSGRIDGEAAGKAASVGAGWVLLGCCGGVIGVVIPYVIEPDVPSMEGLMGTSSEYILGYNEGYKKEVKSKRVKKSFAGCIISGVAEIALYFMMIAISVSSA